MDHGMCFMVVWKLKEYRQVTERKDEYVVFPISWTELEERNSGAGTLVMRLEDGQAVSENMFPHLCLWFSNISMEWFRLLKV